MCLFSGLYNSIFPLLGYSVLAIEKPSNIPLLRVCTDVRFSYHATCLTTTEWHNKCKVAAMKSRNTERTTQDCRHQLQQIVWNV